MPWLICLWTIHNHTPSFNDNHAKTATILRPSHAHSSTMSEFLPEALYAFPCVTTPPAMFHVEFLLKPMCRSARHCFNFVAALALLVPLYYLNASFPRQRFHVKRRADQRSPPASTIPCFGWPD